MINIPAQGVARSPARATPVLSTSAGLFWGIFGLIGIGVAVALVIILHSIPSRLPLTRSADIVTVREAIWASVNGDIRDPLVELSPGVTARQSNLRGFALGGRTYYYYIEGQSNFDPLSRGKLSEHEIEIVMRDNAGPRSLVIYEKLRPQP